MARRRHSFDHQHPPRSQRCPVGPVDERDAAGRLIVTLSNNLPIILSALKATDNVAVEEQNTNQITASEKPGFYYEDEWGEMCWNPSTLGLKRLQSAKDYAEQIERGEYYNEGHIDGEEFNYSIWPFGHGALVTSHSIGPNDELLFLARAVPDDLIGKPGDGVSIDEWNQLDSAPTLILAFKDVASIDLHIKQVVQLRDTAIKQG